MSVGVVTIEKLYRNKLIKIEFSSLSSSDTATFNIAGKILRIVGSATSTDADGDIALKDESGVTYFSIANAFASATSINYIVTAEDKDGNIFGGVPVVGENTITLTDMAGASAATFYIYVSD